MTIADIVRDYERVVYGQAPLAEVVMQLRFPILLALEDRAPAQFQEMIIDEYPKLRILDGLQFTLGPGVAQSQQVRQSKSYAFENAITRETVAISANSITLTTNNYPGWPDFSSRFLALLGRFLKCYKIQESNRVGVRFRNVIDLESIGPLGKPWDDLVNIRFLGLFGSELLRDVDLTSFGTFMQIKLNDICITIQTGLAAKVNSAYRPFRIRLRLFY
jgi:uncharacterized protein (TIGR04255 family)